MAYIDVKSKIFVFVQNLLKLITMKYYQLLEPALELIKELTVKPNKYIPLIYALTSFVFALAVLLFWLKC